MCFVIWLSTVHTMACISIRVDLKCSNKSSRREGGIWGNWRWIAWLDLNGFLVEHEAGKFPLRWSWRIIFHKLLSRPKKRKMNFSLLFDLPPHPPSPQGWETKNALPLLSLFIRANKKLNNVDINLSSTRMQSQLGRGINSSHPHRLEHTRRRRRRSSETTSGKKEGKHFVIPSEKSFRDRIYDVVS